MSAGAAVDHIDNTAVALRARRVDLAEIGVGVGCGIFLGNAEIVESTRSQIANIVDQDHASVSRLTVAANVLADLARV